MARFQDKNGVVSYKGFFTEVQPTTNGSIVNAPRHAASNLIVLPLVGGTNTYTVMIPANALVVEFLISIQTTFNGTTPNISAGSAAAGVDMLPATVIPAGGAQVDAICKAPAAATSATAPSTVFITLSGASSAGAGYLFIHYVPAVPTPINANL